MSKRKDMVGQKFGRLEVKEYAGTNKDYQARWLCECECGTRKVIDGASLRSGKTLSCGCLGREHALEANKGNQYGLKHGGWKNFRSEYQAYHEAKNRCTNPKNVSYETHGGRGIKFLLPTFPEFFAHIGPKPEPKRAYSLDRINNDGNYEVGNIRWATRSQQQRNKRNSRPNRTVNKLMMWLRDDPELRALAKKLLEA